MTFINIKLKLLKELKEISRIMLNVQIYMIYKNGIGEYIC
ncbi:hypothetical protein CLSA_c24640 [Clostridium saccharobutylicum DSM 13864]|uniref:Uncharacterized protein n=1 Tax=Clostridium saccharobutylicum DSM 13864 TaxID=1345695 RepID=U5MSG3_CLOSA|nr:hypothetical protein CLSA_c24640 [Clostridium saccharobutylicum DSM 13864]